MLASTIKSVLDFTVQLKTIYCHILHCEQFLKAKLEYYTAGEAVNTEEPCKMWAVLFNGGFSSLMGNFSSLLASYSTSQSKREALGSL